MTMQIQMLLMINITNQAVSALGKVYKALCLHHTVQKVDERQSESWYWFCYNFITD